MGYTFDRVILGSLCSILAWTCLILLLIHFYRKHNPWSFHPWFLFLSFCWMLLRSLFWFIPIENCPTFFLYYIPISIQFFVFGLLLVWIVFMIYDATRKHNDTLHIWQVEALKIPDSLTTLSSSDRSLNMTHHKTSHVFHVLVISLYMIITLSALVLVITYCSAVCVNAPMISLWADVMSIITGVGFSVLGLLLIIFGGILLYLRIKKSKRSSIDMNSLSNTSDSYSTNLILKLHAPLILPLSILNTLLFLSRTIVNLLPLLPNVSIDTSFVYLRQSNLGKFIIMLCFLCWEIIPICSVLLLLGRGWGRTKGRTNSSQDYLRNRMIHSNRNSQQHNPQFGNYYYQANVMNGSFSSTGKKDGTQALTDSYTEVEETEWDTSEQTRSEMTESVYSEISHTPKAYISYLNDDIMDTKKRKE